MNLFGNNSNTCKRQVDTYVHVAVQSKKTEIFCVLPLNSSEHKDCMSVASEVKGQDIVCTSMYLCLALVVMVVIRTKS